MFSKEQYNNIMENLHVNGNKRNYDWLIDSKEQLEKGMESLEKIISVEPIIGQDVFPNKQNELK